jgi:hypothetical protein
MTSLGMISFDFGLLTSPGDNPSSVTTWEKAVHQPKCVVVDFDMKFTYVLAG